MIIGAMILPDSWMDRLLANIQPSDDVKQVNRSARRLRPTSRSLDRRISMTKARTLRTAKGEKRKLKDELVSLQVPGLNAVQEAGRLLEDLPKLWMRANLGERRKILMSMLEAVYVECQEENRIVAIKPKSAYRPIFEIAETKARSGILLIKDANHGEAPSLEDNDVINGPCSWWGRRRVALLKHGFEVALAA